ncbi:hypothetical protein BGZ94_006571 [Podila epigama]|nr:hypothetical protein BGZ94_006571 [Podila epigama]
MKNLYTIALVATLAIASTISAHEIPQAIPQVDFIDVATQEVPPKVETNDVAAAAPAQAVLASPPSDPLPASAAEEEALWNKKRKQRKHKNGRKHGKKHRKKNGKKNKKHGKKHHKHKKCCIKYITITSVPACKPTPK